MTSYERAKGYSSADFDTPEAPTINEDNSTNEQGPCFKCGVHNFSEQLHKEIRSLQQYIPDLHEKQQFPQVPST